MINRTVVDAGSLVAFLSESDQHYLWAKAAFAAVTPPVLTCDAVLAEAWDLLRNTTNGQTALLDLLEAKAVVPQFELGTELAAVRRLAARYREHPMSLADACLVRMAELFDEAMIMTVEPDFGHYRKHGRQAIPLISPFT